MNFLETVKKKIKERNTLEETIVNEMGEFHFDASVHSYKGAVEIDGKPVECWVDTDRKDGNSALKNMRMLGEFLGKCPQIADKAAQRVADKLIDEANLWLEDENDVLTRDDFYEQLSLESVDVSDNVELSFSAGDIFSEHLIQITVFDDNKFSNPKL